MKKKTHKVHVYIDYPFEAEFIASVPVDKKNTRKRTSLLQKALGKVEDSKLAIGALRYHLSGDITVEKVMFRTKRGLMLTNKHKKEYWVTGS